ncbi:MAG: DUF58 domain-containing protein [Cyclobacteriaceae bacterium]|nr:DUF58 domain-containing protein [Cyclobacteriaceae bacterium]
MSIYRNFFLSSRFFLLAGLLILVMVLAYLIPAVFPIAKLALLVFGVLVITDALVVFHPLSLGDDNPVTLTLTNISALYLSVTVIDEMPKELQLRNTQHKLNLKSKETRYIAYTIRPNVRGLYNFGSVIVFIQTRLGLVKRRIEAQAAGNVAVYPSIIQMKKYELKMFIKTAREFGVKKVRRIGHSYEFEHIKPYTRGDDYRSINWKATGRTAQLMVNQYEDEKSQQVYCLIDKSRVMHMPFEGMSLFDYAVNASLVISNIVLAKQDKAGLITFAEKTKSVLKAERSKVQLKKILENLYNEEEKPVEANYENLYLTVNKYVKGRSLLLLYTNFESTYALQRVLPQLQKLNAHHLLVVVFFENTEVSQYTRNNRVENLEDVYTHILAEDYTLTKIQLAQTLRQMGIHCMLTKPENLTVNSINKYLELKARGMI